jgi:hypothetical protein
MGKIAGIVIVAFLSLAARQALGLMGNDRGRTIINLL